MLKKEKGGEKMVQKLNELALGYSLAIISAAGMLLLGILGNFGIYTGGVESMMRWHIFFDLSIFGIIAGILEAAVFSFVIGYAIAWVYNKFI